MKEQIKPVYYCEFCKKHLFVKHAMVNHELKCYLNPMNIDKCRDCVHCERIEVEYEFDAYYDGYQSQGQVRSATGYKCNSTGKELYPYKAHKDRLPQRFPETFEGKERMPQECAEFKQIDLQEYFNRLS